MPKAGADRSSHEHRRAYDCHSRGSHAYPDTDSLQPHSSPSYPLPLIACSPASLRPTPTHLFCAGPTAKELLSHRWIRAAPSNKCLTSLVDRYERFRSEHPRPPSAYNPSRAKAAYSAPAVLNNDGSWDFGPEDGSSGSTDRGWDFGELQRSGGEQYGSRDGHGAGGSRPAYAPMMRQAGPTYVAPPPIPAQASRDAGGSMKSASAASASSPAHHGGERPASGGHLSSSRAGSVGGGSSAGGAGGSGSSTGVSLVVAPVLARMLGMHQDKQVQKAIAQLKLAFDNLEKQRPEEHLSGQFITQMFEHVYGSGNPEIVALMPPALRAARRAARDLPMPMHNSRRPSGEATSQHNRALPPGWPPGPPPGPPPGRPPTLS